MFEFEDMSSGFHDVFLNKYADSSGPILDFYISDSMQDMLDIDIRTEVATVVGGVNEFTSLINDLPSLDLDINSQDGDISWLGGPKWSATNDIYADVGACVNPNSVMPIIQSSLLNSQKSHINLNTNSYQNNHNNSPLPSPKEKKSHLTFSPNQIKVPSIIHDNIKQRSAYLQQTVGGQQQQQQQQKMTTTTTSNGIRNHQQNHNLHHHHQQQQQHNIDNVKKDLINDLKDEKLLLTNKKIGIQSNILSSGSNTIKLAPGIGGLTFANSLSYAKLKQTSTNNGHISSSSSSVNGSLLTTQQQNKRERDSSSSSSCSPHHQNIYTNNNNNNNTNNNNHHQKSLSRNILVQNKNNITNGIHLSISQQHQHHHQQQQQHHQQNNNNNNSHITKNNKQKIEQQISEYPKPPYSYSCLIAMALKNSRSGSLPVSEIYSFMCEHFPYFKTAPNGWKNSVRHNLSLNKCFEKIEKPTTNGGQRKGCLWAMNPTKITKMDEEVQKWSRKDPMAIRKAMVYPEHLESLERGEMKHGSSGDSDADENEVQSDIEENSDSEEQDDVVETSESVGGDDEDDEQEKEFEIEVTDIYDNIDLNDNKELLRMAIRQNELGEYIENDIPSSKRARLDINYSIGPAGAFDHNSHHQIQQRSSSSSSSSQQQQQHHNRRKMQLVNRIA